MTRSFEDLRRSTVRTARHSATVRTYAAVAVSLFYFGRRSASVSDGLIVDACDSIADGVWWGDMGAFEHEAVP